MAVRVFLADDHPLMRDGVRALLRSAGGVEICGEAGTGADLLQRLQHDQCDVLLLDLSFPDGDGLDILRRIRARGHSFPVVIFTNAVQRAEEAMRAGASGFVAKDCTGEEILLALTEVTAGRSFLSPSATRQRMPGHSPTPVQALPHLDLSRRELDVMLKLARGMRPKEIAYELGISQKTVDTYRSRLFRKIGVSDQRGLLLYALRAQLTDWN